MNRNRPSFEAQTNILNQQEVYLLSGFFAAAGRNRRFDQVIATLFFVEDLAMKCQGEEHEHRDEAVDRKPEDVHSHLEPVS